MRLTSFFSLITACALFASASGATVRDDLTAQLVRDVNVARATTPTIIISDIAKAKSDLSLLKKHVNKLITALKTNAKAKKRPNAAVVMADAETILTDIATVNSSLILLSREV